MVLMAPTESSDLRLINKSESAELAKLIMIVINVFLCLTSGLTRKIQIT